MLSLTVLVTRICNGWHLLCACYMHLGLPRWPSGQESACQSMQEAQGMRVQSPGQEDPRRRPGNPLQCSCLESPHGQRGLAG